jgi:MFS family permease
MTQSLFEGAMYTFVFMWSVAFEAIEGHDIPYGIIFASFMVSIMIGSVIYRVCTQKYMMSAEHILKQTFIVSTLMFVLSAFLSDSSMVLAISFNIFEVCCGIYFPVIGIIRSKHIPEETRSAVMNLFRIPLNLIVVMALVFLPKENIQLVFLFCAGLTATSFMAILHIRE